jgi:tetratricopeptide (TPR) repeat protein
LRELPAPPSTVAPRGWITRELDSWVLSLLAKSPADRPQNAREILQQLATLGGPAGRTAEGGISDSEVDALEQSLLGDASNPEAALALEAAINRGARPERIAQALNFAASLIDEEEDLESKRGLLLRAARLFEASKETLDRADAAYEALLVLDAGDEVALAGLEEVRRRSGKFEELLELLLGRAEAAPGPNERARFMGEIGKLYAREVGDQEQAIVAYTQALCDAPGEDQFAHEIERLAGTNENTWGEVLGSVAEAAQNPELAPEPRNALLLRLGDWYRTKISRPDLALPALQAVLATEPSNEKALVSLTEVYRKAQQWAELGMVLTRRADASGTPAQARDLRTEAAEILEKQMGDAASARGIYEQVLAEDPTHVRASDALGRIYDANRDFDGLVKLLSHRANAQRGAEQVRTLCRIAEIYEDRLNNSEEAIRRYEGALDIDPASLDALRGLERVYAKAGQYKELLETLDQQIKVAATPKQRVALFERMAAVYEEEFLDHEKAAQALERALHADPGRVSAMASLVRFYRVLGRWEDASKLYERQLQLVEEPSERVALGMAWGRVLVEQIGSPDRAAHAYELVLQVDAEHAGALEALAKLRQSSGDADAALEAILALADQANSPEARAEHFVRAARLLDERGDRDGAIDHYRMALDANPRDKGAAMALRAAYVARGDVSSAVNLLEREMERTEGERAQAKLGGELARLLHERLGDSDRAEIAAKKTVLLDPGNLDALLVLGDVAFEDKRFVEASAHYGRLAERAESLGHDQAVRILVRYVDALSKAGSTEKALAPMDTLLRLAPDNAEALARVALVTFENGSARRAAELLTDYLDRFGSFLPDEDRALACYRLGESLRRAGDLEGAVPNLEEACDLDPTLAAPLASLAQLHTARENWHGVVRAKTRHLDVASGDERVQLLLDIGEIASAKLGDRTQATKSYVAALEERPDDRKLLTKLMQLYSEEKDWNKLVEVVLKLADFVDDPAQKVKYLHTAAMVTARQVGDTVQAAHYFRQVLELDPRNLKALEEFVALEKDAGNYRGVEELLKRRLILAEAAEDEAAQISANEELSELYETRLGDPDRAIDALEAALELDPENKVRTDKLAALYETDSAAYLDRAVALQEHLLAQNPYRHDSYKALRKIYTQNRDADASWALCQALSVLQLAEPDEERFYNRMRSDTAAAAQEAFSEEDWMERVMHPTANHLLTAVFSLIEPTVVQTRAARLDQLGFAPEHRIDPSSHHAPLAQTLYYAAGVLGMQVPAVYENANDPGGLSFLNTAEPSLVLGRVGMSSEVPAQVAAFVAARQLAYYRPGMYLRHFIQTGTGLKSWLFAAVKLTVPQFPVAPDLEGPVTEALAALRASLSGDVKELLNSVVSKLIQSGTALDLKKWVAAVDLTADRAGFIVAHDLDSALQVIRASEEGSASVPNQDRFKELVLYSTSAKYFAMRRRLGIAVDS